jgi:hypothetical protein
MGNTPGGILILAVAAGLALVGPSSATAQSQG